MAWTAPRTWVVGEVLTAALLNTHLRDNLIYLKSGNPSFDTGLQIPGSGSYFIEMGAGVGGKATNAGKIGYGFAAAGELAIYGAGTVVGLRTVRIYDALEQDIVPVARARHSAVQSIANNTSTQLALDTVVYNTTAGGSIWTAGANRFQVQRAGYYIVGANVDWSTASVAGERDVFLIVNGATTIARASDTPVALGDAFTQSVATLYYFSVSDYVQINVVQKSGGALNVNAAADYSPELWMVRQV